LLPQQHGSRAAREAISAIAEFQEGSLSMDEKYVPDTPRNRGDHDAPHVSPVTPAEDARSIMLNRVTWGAIFAGVVISLVVQLLLNLLGIGVGASTLDPGSGDNPAASTFSIVAAIWWTLSGIIAALVGGYAAGRLSGQPKESTTAWHGLITWAVATLVIFYLLTSTIGTIVGGTFNQISRAIGGVAQTAATVADDANPFAAIQQQITEGGGGSGVVDAVRSALTGEGDPEQLQEQAAQAIAEEQGIPIEEARAQVEEYATQFEQAADTAGEAADTAANAVTTGALVGFVALLLGAIAAWFGGWMGAVGPTVTGFPRPMIKRE
jgi:hypothetical protein